MWTLIKDSLRRNWYWGAMLVVFDLCTAGFFSWGLFYLFVPMLSCALRVSERERGLWRVRMALPAPRLQRAYADWLVGTLALPLLTLVSALLMNRFVYPSSPDSLHAGPNLRVLLTFFSHSPFSAHDTLLYGVICVGILCAGDLAEHVLGLVLDRGSEFKRTVLSLSPMAVCMVIGGVLLDTAFEALPQSTAGVKALLAAVGALVFASLALTVRATTPAGQQPVAWLRDLAAWECRDRRGVANPRRHVALALAGLFGAFHRRGAGPCGVLRDDGLPEWTCHARAPGIAAAPFRLFFKLAWVKIHRSLAGVALPARNPAQAVPEDKHRAADPGVPDHNVACGRMAGFRRGNARRGAEFSRKRPAVHQPDDALCRCGPVLDSTPVLALVDCGSGPVFSVKPCF
jgi:hypothetical protein